MKIIGGSIEGIDNPPPWGSFPFERALFSQNIMIWKSIQNRFNDRLLTEAVHFRHRVKFSFVLNRMGAAKIEFLNPTRFFCGSNCHPEVGIIFLHRLTTLSSKIYDSFKDQV